MVGGLIKQENVCTAEQNSCQFHTSTLAAGKGSECRVQKCGREGPQMRRSLPLPIRRRTLQAPKNSASAPARIAGRLVPGVCSFGHVRHRLGHAAKTGRNVGQATGVQDSITRQFIGIGGPGDLAAGSRPFRDARTSPDVGARSPDNAFMRVVLPAPLRPTRPIRSPGPHTQLVNRQ